MGLVLDKVGSGLSTLCACPTAVGLTTCIAKPVIRNTTEVISSGTVSQCTTSNSTGARLGRLPACPRQPVTTSSLPWDVHLETVHRVEPLPSSAPRPGPCQIAPSMGSRSPPPTRARLFEVALPTAIAVPAASVENWLLCSRLSAAVRKVWSAATSVVEAVEHCAVPSSSVS